MIRKVIYEFSVSKYKLLKLDGELPKTNYTCFVIDGKKYKPVPVYDAPNCIAVDSAESFLGKVVDFQ